MRPVSGKPRRPRDLLPLEDYRRNATCSVTIGSPAPDFVTEGRSLILAGKPGRGKTHLAIAIAYRAIQNGFDARFTTAAALIDDLSAAFRTGELAHALPTYTHPAVLIVDEVGYLTYGTDAANMLFHVVNERHRRHRPMIFTTNKSLKAWGRVLHDEDLAQAIIDRVLERGRLLRLDGPSVRTLHVNLDDAMKEDSDQQTDVARFPENSGQNFRNPHCPVLSICGMRLHNYRASACCDARGACSGIPTGPDSDVTAALSSASKVSRASEAEFRPAKTRRSPW
jgi:hypothetical protein